MLINGTVLGVAPVKTSLLAIGLVLSVLFTAMKPEASAGLSLIPRLFFWVTHISIGIFAILIASYSVRMLYDKHLPVLAIILITGVIGAALSAPLYFLIEAFFPDDTYVDWLDNYSDRGLLLGIGVEFLEVLPTFLLSWLAINTPLLLNRSDLIDDQPPESPDKDIDQDQQKRQDDKTAFYESLPEIIGRDIVAISSDLHYLNVHTTLGKALILGSLKHCAEFMDDQGMVVHRSNWITKKHVDRVFVSGDKAYCLMSTGLKVPISRSKRKDVKRVFGQGRCKIDTNTTTKISHIGS